MNQELDKKEIRLRQLMNQETLTEQENKELDQLTQELSPFENNDKIIEGIEPSKSSFDQWKTLNNEVHDLKLEQHVLELMIERTKVKERIEKLRGQIDKVFCKTCDKHVTDLDKHLKELIFCDDCKKMQPHSHFE